MASSSLESTVERGSFGPVRSSWTEGRFFHLATVFGLIPWRWANTLRLSGRCWIARRTAAVVRALPCRPWPIAQPSIPEGRVHHQSPGPNSLVDEHQSLGIEIKLALEPRLAPLADVRPVLLGGMRRLFF